MRRQLTEIRTQSLNIPSFTYSDEINATDLIKLKNTIKKAHPTITLLPFFMKACSLAMAQQPILNTHVDSEVDEEGYIQRFVIKHDHNFSIAIALKDGLVVPNIKKVQEKSIV
mmetsp:Transcript_41691/g.56656  ORF Transcript_41691/g.56656 Transcript_41691/m.56656 type:complete len:113 (-) Transcript_41691:378-716(-)